MSLSFGVLDDAVVNVKPVHFFLVSIVVCDLPDLIVCVVASDGTLVPPCYCVPPCDLEVFADTGA